jgi:hypothetical protein
MRDELFGKQLLRERPRRSQSLRFLACPEADWSNNAFYEQLPGLNTEAAQPPAGAFDGSAGPQSGIRSGKRTGGRFLRDDGP